MNCEGESKTAPTSQLGDASLSGQEAPHSTSPEPPSEDGPTLRGERSAPFIKPLRLLDGELDLKNRYLFTVRLKAQSSAIRKECSGVLIDARWVLTAAHCVCIPRSAPQSDHEDKTLFDSSACAATAIVTAVAYLPPLPGASTSTLQETHRGTVRPHPEFKAVLDAQGSLEESHADLALILLEGSTKPSFPHVKLAPAEARIGESLVMAGYGDDESGNGGPDDRRFSTHPVVEIPTLDDDLVTLEPPERPAFQDDSGGPCVRDVKGTSTLVGISHRGLGKASACTSTHIHHAWINEELRRPVRPNSSPVP